VTICALPSSPVTSGILRKIQALLAARLRSDRRICHVLRGGEGHLQGIEDEWVEISIESLSCCRYMDIIGYLIYLYKDIYIYGYMIYGYIYHIGHIGYIGQ
jgi:hypothetical protein